MKRLRDAQYLIRHTEFSTKIKIFFSTKIAGDAFDPYEENYTHTTLNPQTIRGYVTDISPEALIFKEYGLHNIGAVECLVEDRYENWFENAEKIEINDVTYQVFRHGTGSKSILQKRPFKLLRVILQRKD